MLPCYKNWQQGYGLLLVYLFLNVAFMGYSNYLADRGIHNTHIYHFFTIIEAVLIPALINILSPKRFRYHPVIILAFLIFAVINMIIWEPLMSSFNSNAASICNIIISIFCFRYFIELSKNDQVLQFQKLPSFWIVSGFLFYGVVSVLVVSSYRYNDLLSSADTLLTWKIQQVANIIKFVLISIGIACCYRSTSPSSGLSSSGQHH